MDLFAWIYFIALSNTFWMMWMKWILSTLTKGLRLSDSSLWFRPWLSHEVRYRKPNQEWFHGYRSAPDWYENWFLHTSHLQYNARLECWATDFGFYDLGILLKTWILPLITSFCNNTSEDILTAAIGVLNSCVRLLIKSSASQPTCVALKWPINCIQKTAGLKSKD